jgi:Uma2 family endonuclease
MSVYARAGVRCAWLVDPIAKTLEVYRLNLRARWSKPTIHRGAARVRVAPFDAIELDLEALWADVSGLAPALAAPKVTRLRKATAKKAPRR